MVVEKNFQLWNNETETGLVTYVNSNNEIYISLGERNDNFSDDGEVQFNGYHVMDLSDTKALITELKILVKQLDQKDAF